MVYMCPHCNSRAKPARFNSAFANTACYDDSWFILLCPKCKGKVKLFLRRQVVIESVNAAPKDADLSY